MARTIDKIREQLEGEIFSLTELENIMNTYGYVPMEAENDSEDIIKFTNYASQIWVKPESCDGDCVIVDKVSLSTKLESKPTKVRVFQSYEDLIAVLNYFKEHEQYDLWLIAWLCTSLGRRVGDVISLKWSDLVQRNGRYQYRLETLKEEKTGKVVGARINALAKKMIDEYCQIQNIYPAEVYQKHIFIDIDKDANKAQKNKYEKFRKVLHDAVEAAGIDYPVGTHSFRKWYANTIYKLHPQDANNLKTVQQMLGHSSEAMTAIYIEEIDRRIDKYNTDYSDFMLDKMGGKETEISNSPIVSLKAEDFRDILSQLWNIAVSGADKFDAINEIMGLAEKCML